MTRYILLYQNTLSGDIEIAQQFFATVSEATDFARDNEVPIIGIMEETQLMSFLQRNQQQPVQRTQQRVPTTMVNVTEVEEEPELIQSDSRKSQYPANGQRPNRGQLYRPHFVSPVFVGRKQRR